VGPRELWAGGCALDNQLRGPDSASPLQPTNVAPIADHHGRSVVNGWQVDVDGNPLAGIQ
jgi:hypothetical protein